jgi:hypothetical protein
MVILPLKLHIKERLNMKYDWQGVLYRLTSRKFILTVVTFLLFVFSEQLGLSDEIKNHLLVTFLGYVGVEGLADVVDRFKE